MEQRWEEAAVQNPKCNDAFCQILTVPEAWPDLAVITSSAI